MTSEAGNSNGDKLGMNEFSFPDFHGENSSHSKKNTTLKDATAGKSKDHEDDFNLSVNKSNLSCEFNNFPIT